MHLQIPAEGCKKRKLVETYLELKPYIDDLPDDSPAWQQTLSDLQWIKIKLKYMNVLSSPQGNLTLEQHCAHAHAVAMPGTAVASLAHF